MVTRVSKGMIEDLTAEFAGKQNNLGLTGVVSEWDEQEAETTDKAMAPAAVVGAIAAVVGGGGGVNIQVFDTPGDHTYTPTPGLKSALVVATGGGGGGGRTGYGGGGSGNDGGAGAGGTAIALFDADDIGSSVSLNVGDRGLRMGAGTTPSGPGGVTSFLSLTANGGGGGAINNVAVGGSASGGLLNMTGGSGSGYNSGDDVNGAGGTSFWGGGYGAGGNSGQQGVSGVVFILEFL